jgi:ubiquinone/menaquinone biosynthesis C-methylase UbiE
MSMDRFTREVDRARRVYDEYETECRYETLWAPFDEVEAAYRSRQIIAMAELMREAGRANLDGMRVLDVGCGRGRHLRGFVDTGARPEHLVGIDVHEQSLAVARSISPQLRFSAFNGWEIPYPDATFDLVTQFVVFSSISLPDLRWQLATEMVRVLSPGGYVFWWDTLRLAQRASGTHERLEVESLFPGLPRNELQLGRQPTLGECMRVPRWSRRFVRPLLDRLPLVNYPTTHLAALVGPKA